jgi:hypothetical protein
VSLTVIYNTDGKIVAAFRPQGGEKIATPVLLEGQRALEISDEPEELAPLSVREIGNAHAVDLASGRLVRK